MQNAGKDLYRHKSLVLNSVGLKSWRFCFVIFRTTVAIWLDCHIDKYKDVTSVWKCQIIFQPCPQAKATPNNSVFLEHIWA